MRRLESVGAVRESTSKELDVSFLNLNYTAGNKSRESI